MIDQLSQICCSHSSQRADETVTDDSTGRNVRLAFFLLKRSYVKIYRQNVDYDFRVVLIPLKVNKPNIC